MINIDRRILLKRVGLTMIILLIVAFLCFVLKLFVIGEPIDGAQLHWTASANGNTLELWVNSDESAVALRGWKLKQDGSTLSISARKVLVSPLFSDGTFQTSVQLEGITNIYLGGRLIWPCGD